MSAALRRGLKVSDEAFGYLIHQRGNLWDLKDDRGEWLRSYQRIMRTAVAELEPWLDPTVTCRASTNVLDIGAGMGGIDLYLWRALDGQSHHTLIDALDGPAEPSVYHEPYGSLRAAKAFLVENGMPEEAIRLFSAADKRSRTWGALPMFDLVISLQAWGFHFPVGEYLEQVQLATKSGGLICLDLRRERPEWRIPLEQAFGEPVQVLTGLTKYERLLFRKP